MNGTCNPDLGIHEPEVDVLCAVIVAYRVTPFHDTQMNSDVERMTLTVLLFISSAMFHLLNLGCWSACKHCKQDCKLILVYGLHRTVTYVLTIR